MSHAPDEFGRNAPEYVAQDNEPLQRSATRALRRALLDASEHATQLDDFWQLFREFVARYQYGNFIDQLVDEMRDDIRRSIFDKEYASLRKEALDRLTEEVREQMEDEIGDRLHDEVEAEVRAKLVAEIEPKVKVQLRSSLIEEMRPSIAEQVKANLLSDASLIAEVKADLKKQILGL